MLGEVRDAKSYVTGLKVSPTGKCSSLEGLRINSQSSDHLEQVNCRRMHGRASFHVSSHRCLQRGTVISEVGGLLHFRITFLQPSCKKAERLLSQLPVNFLYGPQRCFDSLEKAPMGQRCQQWLNRRPHGGFMEAIFINSSN